VAKHWLYQSQNNRQRVTM